MACNLAHTGEYAIVAETPEMHAAESVATYIAHEVARPSKQWIMHIIDGKQESNMVVLRTSDYVLLPDTERVNRYTRDSRPSTVQARAAPKRTLNWLAIAQDKGIRTIRDLRGHHLPMLKDMLQTCMDSVERETGIRAEQVMAYVHYPPSVYQLHVHFSYPYGQYCHRDAYRVHNLATVINNLEIDPDFYLKATLFMTLYPPSPHYAALLEALRGTEKKQEKRASLAGAILP